MISAVEALDLPGAKLSADELKLLEQLDAIITEAVMKQMKRNGVNLVFENMTNMCVVAAMNHRLVQLGWGANWEPIMKRHPLNQAVQQHIGYTLSLFPSEAALVEHSKKSAH